MSEAPQQADAAAIAAPRLRAGPAMLALAALAALVLLLPLMLEVPVDPAWRGGLHLLLELGIATIAFAIFLLTWNTHGWHPPVSLTGTGAAMLGVALLSAAHLVTAPGMPGMRAEAACAVSGGFAFGAQAWLAAAMLFTALAPWHSPQYGQLFRKALGVTAVWTAGVAALAGFADTHTLCESPQRQWSELALLAGFGTAALLLARRGRAAGSAAVLAWAACLMAGSAAIFVLQPRSNDSAVLLAHLYKLAGCALVYMALFREGVDRPYRRIAQCERIADDHDTLTALPNRRSFLQRLATGMARTRRGDRQLAVMVIDLDEFHHINDTLGHHCGDALLREAARRLRAALRDDDTLARLGNDEFAVLIENVARKEDCDTIARKLLEVLAEVVQHDGQQMQVGASIGITLFPTDGQARDELLRQADLALHRAKEGGGQRWCFFEMQMDRSVLERAALQQDLRTALARGELHLHYQPRVHAADHRLSGVEALLRWRHPERGNVSPDRFIPLAEHNGSIVPIGEWVLREACTQARRWLDAGIAPAMLAVNVSARQLRDPDFVDCVDTVLRETGWPPQRLELELTETVLMEGSQQSRHTLTSLAELGVRLAVDDFGTGYSSLAYLKRFKLHRLKVDKSFVNNLESDRDDRVIASTVIALGHALGLQVTAEGVETAAQSAFLAAQGCDELQGYLFSRPLPPEDCERLLRGTPWTAPAHAARQMPLLPSGD